jgi:3-hydroxyisobutyrate dehydrogenase
MAAGKPKLGFIGIGAMGDPMAACLLKAGYDATVFDVRPARIEEFKKAYGGTGATALKDLAASDVVLMILPNSSIVSDVLFGKDGLAAHLKPGTVIADMTSGVPGVTVSLSRRLAEADILFFDAPVSGGVVRAVSGQLAS